MHRLIPFFFLLFVTSCSVYTPGRYFSAPAHSISNIPLRPHTNDVDLFFNNEKPGKPYYRIKMVEVTGDPFLSSDQMLLRLKEQAKREGLDGLLIQDIGKQANTTTTLPSGDGVIAYQKLVALGVKYKDQITYMDEILKEQMVKLWPDENPEPKQFSIDFNLKGELLPTKDEFTDRFFQYELYPFEDENTVYAPLPEWGYRLDTLNFFFSKRLVKNEVPVVRSTFKLIGTNMLTATIKLKLPGTESFTKYELERYYNKQSGRPIERKLKKPKAKTYVWEEEVSYRYNGLPDKIKRYRYVNGEKRLYFEIQNVYHKADDLPATDN